MKQILTLYLAIILCSFFSNVGMTAPAPIDSEMDGARLDLMDQLPPFNGQRYIRLTHPSSACTCLLLKNKVDGVSDLKSGTTLFLSNPRQYVNESQVPFLREAMDELAYIQINFSKGKMVPDPLNEGLGKHLYSDAWKATEKIFKARPPGVVHAYELEMANADGTVTKAPYWLACYKFQDPEVTSGAPKRCEEQERDAAIESAFIMKKKKLSTAIAPEPSFTNPITDKNEH